MRYASCTHLGCWTGCSPCIKQQICWCLRDQWNPVSAAFCTPLFPSIALKPTGLRAELCTRALFYFGKDQHLMA